MLLSKVYTRHAFATRLGYKAVSADIALYRALAGQQIRYQKLCDIAERLGLIPLLFYNNRTGKPMFGAGEDRFRQPTDYDYLRTRYARDVLKQRRAQSKWDFSLSELSGRTGFWKQTIFEIEHGDYTPSVPQNLERICQPLGITPEYFVGPLDKQAVPPERKSVNESLSELMDAHREISTIKKLSKFIGWFPWLVGGQIERDTISSGLLLKICESLRVERHSLKKSRMLPFVIWYYSSRTNSWQVETLGSDMLITGKMPERYADKTVSKHRLLTHQHFEQLTKNREITRNKRTGFQISRMETALRPLNLISQYFVKTLQVD